MRESRRYENGRINNMKARHKIVKHFISIAFNIITWLSGNNPSREAA